jgi:diguanylate cyclase (GGDEF)-like protein
MQLTVALIYWVIVALWVTVLGTVAYFYVRHPRAFGTTRLLLFVIGIDTCRNIFENFYFGLYFGAQYGMFDSWIIGILGRPGLLILPKLMNIAAACLVLGLLLFRWLPMAVAEWKHSEKRAHSLRSLAAIDALTGIYNRRQFEKLARAELARCQRYQRPLSVLVLDIDHFKNVNDLFGHEAGDHAIKAMASLISAAKRDSDVAARIGGEEFAVLLPETGKDAARIFAERLCASVRACAIDVEEVGILRITTSIGVAEATASTSGLDALMRDADRALYDAKNGGRDRVVVAMSVSQAIAAAAE